MLFTFFIVALFFLKSAAIFPLFFNETLILCKTVRIIEKHRKWPTSSSGRAFIKTQKSDLFSSNATTCYYIKDCRNRYIILLEISFVLVSAIKKRVVYFIRLPFRTPEGGQLGVIAHETLTARRVIFDSSNARNDIAFFGFPSCFVGIFFNKWGEQRGIDEAKERHKEENGVSSFVLHALNISRFGTTAADSSHAPCVHAPRFAFRKRGKEEARFLFTFFFYARYRQRHYRASEIWNTLDGKFRSSTSPKKHCIVKLVSLQNDASFAVCRENN